MGAFIDKIWENKDEFDNFQLPEFEIDHEKIDELLEDLSKLDIYLPILILDKLDYGYVDTATDEAREQMGKAHTLYRVLCENEFDSDEDLSSELLLKDLYAWVQEHKEYEDILIYKED